MMPLRSTADILRELAVAYPWLPTREKIKDTVMHEELDFMFNTLTTQQNCIVQIYNTRNISYWERDRLIQRMRALNDLLETVAYQRTLVDSEEYRFWKSLYLSTIVIEDDPNAWGDEDQ